MDLTDDELWYLSYLDISNEEQNMAWEGFPESSSEEKITLVSERFLYERTFKSFNFKVLQNGPTNRSFDHSLS